MSTPHPGTNTEEHKERFAESGHRTVDRLADKLKAGEDRLAQTSDQIRHQSERSVRQVRSYVEQHPIVSLGVAFAAGAVLSTLMKK